MFSTRLRDAVAASGYTIRELSEKTGIPKRTIDKWTSPSNPTLPRVDEAVQLGQLLGVSVEELATGKPLAPVPPAPFGDIIKDLNALPESRLDDVRRLIAPWANEVRGAAQQVIDIVADLKVLPKERLDDLRRLVKPWAEEARHSVERGDARRGEAKSSPFRGSARLLPFVRRLESTRVWR